MANHSCWALARRATARAADMRVPTQSIQAPSTVMRAPTHSAPHTMYDHACVSTIGTTTSCCRVCTNTIGANAIGGPACTNTTGTITVGGHACTNTIGVSTIGGNACTITVGASHCVARRGDACMRYIITQCVMPCNHRSGAMWAHTVLAICTRVMPPSHI